MTTAASFVESANLVIGKLGKCRSRFFYRSDEYIAHLLRIHLVLNKVFDQMEDQGDEDVSVGSELDKVKKALVINLKLKTFQKKPRAPSSTPIDYLSECEHHLETLRVLIYGGRLRFPLLAQRDLRWFLVILRDLYSKEI